MFADPFEADLFRNFSYRHFGFESGGDSGNEGCRESVAEPSDDMAQSLKVELPPLGVVVFRLAKR